MSAGNGRRLVSTRRTFLAADFAADKSCNSAAIPRANSSQQPPACRSLARRPSRLRQRRLHGVTPPAWPEDREFSFENDEFSFENEKFWFENDGVSFANEIFRLRTTRFGLRTKSFRSRTTEFRLQTKFFV